MITIHAVTDIENYVTNSRPDAVEHGLVDALVSAIQGSAHPDYGADWSEWLGANTGELLLAIAER